MDLDNTPRFTLSVRLGAGLGIVYTLLFAACLMNISNTPKAAGLAAILLIVLVATGYIWIYYQQDVRDFIEHLKE